MRWIGNPHIGVTIDTFHANIEETSICGAIRSLGPHLKHIHASENDRGPLGSGHIPSPNRLDAQEMHYEGYVMIEGFGYGRKRKKGQAIFGQSKMSPLRNSPRRVFRYLADLMAG